MGVAFEGPVVARVQIEYGTVLLSLNDSTLNDVAVMDNLIYSQASVLMKAYKWLS
ncbi:MAG TPA: hypothetical protein VHK27_08610 [Gammaproteobacteria bacterium]|nr:hypothetical protein [Gammaproteobacteria bacterium]